MKPGLYKDVLAFCWRHWRRHPWALLALGSGLTLAAATELTIPYFAGRMMDAVAGDLPRADAAGVAFGWLMALLVAALLYWTLRHGGEVLWARMASRIMRTIIVEAHARVQRHSSDWHGSTFAGATVRSITRGMWAFDMLGDTLYFALIPALLVLSGLTVALAVSWWELGLAVGLGSLLFVTVSLVLARRYISPAMAEANAQDSRLGGALADSLTCNAVVKAFAAEVREDARFDAAAGQWRGMALRAWDRMIATGTLQSAMLLVLQAALLGLSLDLWRRGVADTGDVTFALTAYFLISGYLRDIGMHIRNFQHAVSDMEDVVAYARMASVAGERPGTTALRVHGGAIAFESVGFGYANQAGPVYRDLSVSIAAGEKVALVGRSGSGKSTFVKLLMRLNEPHAGRILIDGQDIATATLESLREATALVPQDPILFHRGLGENIAYARPEATLAEIEGAARRAHAHDFIERLPNGYETLVGERGVKLSGGERQRLAIARAMLADRPILVLDEATSSLDSASEAHIQAALRDLMRGRTTIVIAHRLSTIRDVDRILVFEAGRIVEQGRHDALLRLGGAYKRLYDMQADGFLGEEAA